jgi:hypothetical protein
MVIENRNLMEFFSFFSPVVKAAKAFSSEPCEKICLMRVERIRIASSTKSRGIDVNIVVTRNVSTAA